MMHQSDRVAIGGMGPWADEDKGLVLGSAL
jgi:hypothetical protein